MDSTSTVKTNNNTNTSTSIEWVMQSLLLPRAGISKLKILRRNRSHLPVQKQFNEITGTLMRQDPRSQTVTATLEVYAAPLLLTTWNNILSCLVLRVLCLVLSIFFYFQKITILKQFSLCMDAFKIHFIWKCKVAEVNKLDTHRA